MDMARLENSSELEMRSDRGSRKGETIRRSTRLGWLDGEQP